jgi:beta-glucosidase
MKVEKNNYLDASLTPQERADDLLQRMRIEEKMGQICGYMPELGAIDRLVADYPHGVGEVSMLFAGSLPDKEAVAEQVAEIQQQIMKLSEHSIPAMFHFETLTGALMPEATSFPTGIGQASTWNPPLQKEMAEIIRKQIRAVGVAHAFAPVLDISRDSRFGRQGETYGEDPALASAMGTAYVAGLQNDGDLKDGVLACAKHFLGYHGTQGGIHAAATNIPKRELREIYAKPFQAAMTEAQMKSIMNSYSSIDSEPIAGSRTFLTELLREEMGFAGLLVSDYTSIQELYTRHKVSESKTDAGERSLKAGMDVELPSRSCYNEELMRRIQEDHIEMEHLDRAVRNVLVAKFEAGLFENPFPLAKNVRKEIFTDSKNEQVGTEMARQSLVLLKNNGILPLNRNKRKIAVIGHHAASLRSIFGAYSFVSLTEALFVENTMAGVDFEKISNVSKDEFDQDRGHYTYPGTKVRVEPTAVEEHVKKYYPSTNHLLEQIKLDCPEAEVTYSYGYAYAGNDTSLHEAALATAVEADLVILTLGGKFGWGTSCSTGEGVDAVSINLPECQENFIRKLAALKKPTVAIHFDGRPISSDMADQHIDAIIEAWNPGQFAAKAITDVLFGVYNPSGRLPVSVAYHTGQIPVYYNHVNGSSYDVGTDSAFTSYVDCPREPRYYFGHGLSYTTFAYSNLRIGKEAYEPNESLTVYVDVTNTGDVAGEEVVQMYVSDPLASMVRPVKELAGFAKVPLQPKEKKTVEFTMELSQFAFLDTDMRWKVESGEMEVMVGASSHDIREKGAFRINSDLFVDGKTRGFYAEAQVLHNN